MVSLDSEWSDLGSWLSVYECMPKDKYGNVVIGNVELHNVKNSFVYSAGQKVAVSDAEGLLLVQSDKAVLSCKLAELDHIGLFAESAAAKK
jgi:mannose-1-phosphate guanylyltransferase